MKDVTAPTLESSELIDSKTVALTFSEDVKAATDKEISVKVNKKIASAVTVEGKVVTATFDSSILAASTAATTLPLEISNVADTSDNLWVADENATYTVEQKARKLAKLSYIQTTLPDSYDYSTTAPEGTYNSENNVTVDFTAKDQYGENYTLTSNDVANATATIEGSPLTTAISGKQITISANKAIKAGAKLALKLTVKDKEDTLIAEESKTFDVEKNEGQTSAVDLSEIVADKDGDLDAEDASKNTVTLTVKGVNKFNKPGLTLATGDVNWSVSDPSVVEVDASTHGTVSTDGSSIVGGDGTLKLKAKKAGTATITAYLASDVTKTQTYTVTVGETALKELKGGTIADGYNHEEIISAIIEPNKGADLTADMLKAEILSKPTAAEGETTPDPEITFAYEKDANGKDTTNVVAKIKTSVAGDYKVAFYTGASYDAADAVKTSPITFKTRVNPTVDKITLESITQVANGSTVKKAITFKNAHDEDVSVNAEDLAITTSDAAKLDVTTLKADGSTASGAVAVEKLGFTGKAEGDVIVTLSTGTAEQVRFSLKVLKEATLTTVTLGTNSVDLINNDAYDKDADADADTDGIIIGGDHKAYTLVPITLKDQRGDEMPFSQTNLSRNVKVTVADADSVDYKLKYFDINKKDVASTSGDVAYIGVSAQKSTTPEAGKLTVYDKDVSSGTTGATALATLSLNAKEERKVDSVTATPSSATAALNVDVTYMLTATDQYKDPIAISFVSATTGATNPSDVTFTGTKVSDPDNTNAYGFKLKATKAGTYNYSVTAKSSYTGDTGKSITVSLTGKSDVDIQSVSIDPVLKEATYESTEYKETGRKFDTSKYPLLISKDATKQDYILSCNAVDRDGENVTVDDATFITGVTLKSIVDSTGKDVTSTSTAGFSKEANGVKNAISFANSGLNKGDKVTLEVATSIGKTADLTFTVDPTASVAEDGTEYVVDVNATKQTSITEIDTPTDGSLAQIAVKAKDQYGQTMDVTAKYYSRDKSVATIDDAGVITPQSKGDATIQINIGNKEMFVTVHVSKETADLIPVIDFVNEKVNIATTLADGTTAWKYLIDTNSTVSNPTTVDQTTVNPSITVGTDKYIHVSKGGSEDAVWTYAIPERPTLDLADDAIDYDNGTIKLPATQSFKLDTGAYTQGTDKAVSIGADTTAKSLKIKLNATATAFASAEKEIYVKKATAPTSTEITGATYKKDEGLKITGTPGSEKYQISKDDGKTWGEATAITSGTAVSGTETWSDDSISKIKIRKAADDMQTGDDVDNAKVIASAAYEVSVTAPES